MLEHGVGTLVAAPKGMAFFLSSYHRDSFKFSRNSNTHGIGGL
jgi:hypothetical protein